MNILLVEDNEPMGKTLSEILLAWGHHVRWVKIGKDALLEARRNSYDLILLDISLPDIQGYELIPSFNALQPEVGIVTMTGHNSMDLEVKVRKEGIVYYMIKPFDLRILKDILKHVSGKRSRRIPHKGPWPKSEKIEESAQIR